MIPSKVKGCLDDIVENVTPEFEQKMFDRAIKELNINRDYPAYRNIRYKMYEEAIKYDNNRRYG